MAIATAIIVIINFFIIQFLIVTTNLLFFASLYPQKLKGNHLNDVFFDFCRKNNKNSHKIQVF
jgi:hypothetical protein